MSDFYANSPQADLPRFSKPLSFKDIYDMAVIALNAAQNAKVNPVVTNNPAAGSILNGNVAIFDGVTQSNVLPNSVLNGTIMILRLNSTDVITITGAGGATINGQANLILNQAGQSVLVCFDKVNNNWFTNP